MANKDNENKYEYRDDGPLIPLDSEKYEKDEALVPLLEKVCPKCGKKYPFIEKYCSACGTKLVEENELGSYRKTEEQRKQYEAEQQRRAEEERRRQSQRIESLEEENRRMRQKLKAEETTGRANAEASKPEKKSGCGLKTIIFILIIAAAGLFGYKMYQKVADLENQLTHKNQLKPVIIASNTAAARAAKNYSVGDIIEFGSYPYEEDGTEKPIEWQILEKYNDGTALVVSKYALDNVKYNETYTSVTWETSKIRRWLNNEFYNKAFRNANKNLIVQSYVENKDNADYGTRGGNDTYDKMFLLSIDEAEKYFSSDNARKAYPTPYANLKTMDSKDPYEWWLRSPGSGRGYAAYVHPVGFVYSYGDIVNNLDPLAVRVAFKINLNNL